MSLRLFYATDIHGSEPCFLKFLNAAAFYHCSLLIMGGDITGKMLVPLVRSSESGVYEGAFLEQKWRAETEDELREVEKKVRKSAAYPYRCEREEYERIAQDEAYRTKVFGETMLRETRRLVEIAEEKLARSRVRCYLTPGNDDELIIDSSFDGCEWLSNPEGEVVQIDDDHEMISSGYANMTPWNCPRDESEEYLARRIEQMASRLEWPENAIFNLHCPPHASQLDDAPELDPDLNPVLVSGQFHIIPVGSEAVREAISRWQPLAGLHGHIHESRGCTTIGRTKCFNPGSEYGSGYLRGLILELDKHRVKQYQFTAG